MNHLTEGHRQLVTTQKKVPIHSAHQPETTCCVDPVLYNLTQQVTQGVQIGILDT